MPPLLRGWNDRSICAITWFCLNFIVWYLVGYQMLSHSWRIILFMFNRHNLPFCRQIHTHTNTNFVPHTYRSCVLVLIWKYWRKAHEYKTTTTTTWSRLFLVWIIIYELHIWMEWICTYQLKKKIRLYFLLQ